MLKISTLLKAGFVFFFLLLINLCSLQAQILTPVKWTFTAVKTGDKTYELTWRAAIDKHWHIFSQFTADGGPTVTLFTFETKDGVTYEGKIKELSRPIKQFDKGFELETISFEKEAVFKQNITLTKDVKEIKGSVEYGACDEKQCLPPKTVDFVFDLTKASAKSESKPLKEEKKNEAVVEKKEEDTAKKTSSTEVVKDEKENTQKTVVVSEQNKTTEEENTESKSLWTIFIECLLGGFASLLTPCVYPMIPLTVSFFIKKQQNKARGIFNAGLFGFSIILIYVTLGFLVTILVGKSNALNDLSTNIWFNLIFFVIFIIFAISFFGAFELTLPSKWVNKSDSMSERGGLIGIFFVAFTLVLVSFSCTAPAVGPLLGLAIKGGFKGPLIGMFGFSLAFAIPFTFFAIFPSLLQNLPKSGGWLNSVKVVFGFLELALALKFLSNVDLAYHWGFLKREYFLAMWIVIFALMGFYLLGKIKFSHDTDLPYVSIPRLFFVIITFSFTLYMIPGLWGAPLNMLGGLLPPHEYTEGSFGGAVTEAPHKSSVAKKYDPNIGAPYHLDVYYDYEQAMQVARKEHKPLMLDFTGFNCTNCRLMEQSAWGAPKVLDKLKNDVVVASLFADDKKALDENEVYTSTFSNQKIKRVGDKWSDFEVVKFNTNTLPYYVLLDNEGNKISTSIGYDPNGDNPERMYQFLEEGIKNFKAKK